VPETVAKKQPRVPTYKDAAGNYLVVVEVHGEYEIHWRLAYPEVGAALGEQAPSEDTCPESDIAYKACERFCYQHCIPFDDGVPFRFESIKLARQALRAANIALHAARAKRPMPNWANMAIGHGWVPPPGWSP
jgi:hypothetical protein